MTVIIGSPEKPVGQKSQSVWIKRRQKRNWQIRSENFVRTACIRALPVRSSCKCVCCRWRCRCGHLRLWRSAERCCTQNQYWQYSCTDSEGLSHCRRFPRRWWLFTIHVHQCNHIRPKRDPGNSPERLRNQPARNPCSGQQCPDETVTNGTRSSAFANIVRSVGGTVQNCVIADRADVQSILGKILLQTGTACKTADTKTITVDPN